MTGAANQRWDRAGQIPARLGSSRASSARLEPNRAGSVFFSKFIFTFFKIILARLGRLSYLARLGGGASRWKPARLRAEPSRAGSACEPANLTPDVISQPGAPIPIKFRISRIIPFLKNPCTRKKRRMRLRFAEYPNWKKNGRVLVKKIWWCLWRGATKCQLDNISTQLKVENMSIGQNVNSTKSVLRRLRISQMRTDTCGPTIADDICGRQMRTDISGRQMRSRLMRTDVCGEKAKVQRKSESFLFCSNEYINSMPRSSFDFFTFLVTPTSLAKQISLRSLSFSLDNFSKMYCSLKSSTDTVNSYEFNTSVIGKKSSSISLWLWSVKN